MSADKYAQFIAEQQRKLSVSGVNAVDLQEKKKMSKADIAKLREPKDDIDADDLEALRNKEHLKKEEVEALDEISAIKGVHAIRMRKAPSITPSKVRYKGRGSKPKVQTDLNITASYEISADESAYLEEMVGKGKLNDILMHHKDNMRHHDKMMLHHMAQADKAEEVGDDRGFDHHTGEAMHHDMQANHHKIRFDHATGLKARANAQREMKAAQSAMKSASEKIAAAKQDKRDWG